MKTKTSRQLYQEISSLKIALAKSKRNAKEHEEAAYRLSRKYREPDDAVRSLKKKNSRLIDPSKQTLREALKFLFKVVFKKREGTNKPDKSRFTHIWLTTFIFNSDGEIIEVSNDKRNTFPA